MISLPHYPRRHGKLPDVTHCMLSRVPNAADDSRGKLRTSHCAKIAERFNVDGAELSQRFLDSRIQFFQSGRNVPL